MSKRDRQRAARRRGRTERQRHTRESAARANRVFDPATEPDEAAAILYETYGDAPVEMPVAATIAAGGGIERARAVAEAALARGRGPLALSLAADVAILDGREGEAERHVAEALELAESPDLCLRLAAIQAAQGRLEEAIGVLEAELAPTPGLQDLQIAYGDLLAEAQRRGEAPQALQRFRDRTALRELQAEIGRYVGTSEERSEAFAAGLMTWIEANAVTDDELTEWTDRASADPASPEASRLQLMGEWAWLTPVSDDGGSLLDAFAADSALPAPARRRAADWLGWAMWGLWEVGVPEGTPGVLLTELLTGVRLYVEVPAALLAELPRWSVLLGAVLPVDGVWRAGGGLEGASPIEARELVHELIDGLVEHGKELGKEGRPAVAWARRAHEFTGALWTPGAVELTAEALAGLRMCLRSAMPELVGALRAMRGDQAVAGGRSRWFVLDVDDPDDALDALAELPDFEPEDGDLAWLGEEGEDGRELRATLGIDEDARLVLELLPEEEPAELLALLEAAGHPAALEELEVEDDRPEPPIALPDVPGDELADWLRAWPDEPLDALDGQSPRDALERHQAYAEVEVLIRYLEHDADVRGVRELDTNGLRRQLGLLED